MVYLAATVVAAVLTWMAFPPLDLGFLAFLAPAPFLWSLRRVELPRQAAGLGFLYGAVLWGAMLYWIFTLGAVAWIPLTIAMAGYAALYGLLMWVAREMAPWRWWLIAVGGWALWEFLRARYPFGGFPWGSLGYAVGAIPWPRGAAQWIGASGLGVLAVATAAGIALTVGDTRRWRYAAWPGAVAVVLSVAGAIWAPGGTDREWAVAIVQGSTPCPRVHCLDEKELIYEAHMALTRSLPANTYDLVVWGENATGGRFEPVANPEVAIDLSSEARRLDSYLMISGTRGEGPDAFLNVNLLISPDGVVIGEYRKRHPVPFGEYIPFRDYLDWIPQLDQVPRDMVRGTEPVVFDVAAGTLGSVISFEGAFARELRASARLGAQLITVNTNESSYGETAASDQLLGMTRVGAAENGVAIVHAAISGKSALIMPDGSLRETTGLFEQTSLSGLAPWSSARRTLYTRWGDWVQVLAMAVIPVGLLVRKKKRRQDYLFAPPPERRIL